MEEKEVQFIRCRFLDLYPSSIMALAYSSQSNILAVGRQNGSIQLYDSHSMNCFYQITGYHKDSLPICKLHWYGSQLLMTSLSGYLIEWDLKEGSAKRNILADGGGVWDSCLVNDSLFVACEDGAIRAISLADQYEFYPAYSSIPQPARAISICGAQDHKIIYSGHSDGTLARWDSSKSKTASSLMKVSSKSTPITALCVIQKYTSKELVVGGDSKGNLSIWDFKASVRLINLQTHKAAILSIKQKSGQIYATGSDSLIVCVAQQAPMRWKVQNSERAQSHDVLALEIINGTTLVSGGITTDLCVHSLSAQGTFQESYGNHVKNKSYRHVVGMSALSKVKHSASSGVVFLGVNKNTSLELFKLINYKEELVGNFKFKGTECISIFALQALSESQILLAVCQISSFRVISYNGNTNEAEVIYEEKLTHSFKSLHFGKHYLYALDSTQTLILYKVSVTMTVKKEIEKNFKQEEGLLLRAQFSPDCSYLCLLYQQQKLSIIKLDKYRNLHFDLPSVKNNSASCISFQSQTHLIVTYSNNQIVVVDLEKPGLADWSLNYSFQLPKALLSWYNKVKGTCKLTDQQALLFSHNGFFAVDFRQSPPKGAKFVRHQLTYQDRAEQDQEEQWFDALESLEKMTKKEDRQLKLKPFEINTQNFGILGMERVEQSILVYECDFSKMVKQFPKTLKIKKYGF